MAKELHITIYDQIGSGGFFFEDGITAKGIQEKLAANAEASEIVLHINSPGGSVYEGYTIYNLLKGSGKKITAKVEGICASIATLIALSAEEIEMLPLAQWLIHNPFTMIEGDADDLEQAAAELKRIEETLVGIYVTKTGKSDQEIKDLMNEDRFLNADEALELGFANRIAEPLKAVAFYQSPKTNQSNNVMTEEVQNSLADKILNGLKGFLKPKAEAEAEPAPVAATETLEGGEVIYFEGSLEEGTLVYTDEAMTVLVADGEHVLADGRTITVAEGAVTAISEPAPANNADLDAANARIQELEGQLATIQNSAAEQVKTIKNLQAQVRTKTVAKPAQNFAGDSGKAAPELVPFNSAADKIKAKYNAK